MSIHNCNERHREIGTGERSCASSTSKSASFVHSSSKTYDILTFNFEHDEAFRSKYWDKLMIPTICLNQTHVTATSMGCAGMAGPRPIIMSDRLMIDLVSRLPSSCSNSQKASSTTALSDAAIWPKPTIVYMFQTQNYNQRCCEGS